MGTVEACIAYGVKLLPYGVLSGGFLSGKYLNGQKPEGARHTRLPKFQSRYCCKAVEVATEKYKALADKKGLTLTQLAVAWCAPLTVAPLMFLVESHCYKQLVRTLCVLSPHM